MWRGSLGSTTKLRLSVMPRRSPGVDCPNLPPPVGEANGERPADGSLHENEVDALRRVIDGSDLHGHPGLGCEPVRGLPPALGAGRRDRLRRWRVGPMRLAVEHRRWEAGAATQLGVQLGKIDPDPGGPEVGGPSHGDEAVVRRVGRMSHQCGDGVKGGRAACVWNE